MAKILIDLVRTMETPTPSSVLERFLSQNPSVRNSDARAALSRLIYEGNLKVGSGWTLYLP